MLSRIPKIHASIAMGSFRWRSTWTIAPTLTMRFSVERTANHHPGDKGRVNRSTPGLYSLPEACTTAL
jgi:hypothetical protein